MYIDLPTKIKIYRHVSRTRVARRCTRQVRNKRVKRVAVDRQTVTRLRIECLAAMLMLMLMLVSSETKTALSKTSGGERRAARYPRRYQSFSRDCDNA